MPLYIKKIYRGVIKFFVIIWELIKTMKNWKGILALFISFFIYYGWALLLLIIGTISKNVKLYSIALSVMAFWAGPMTPLIPLILVTALLIQRYIFFDKSNEKALKDSIYNFRAGIYPKAKWKNKEEKKIYKKTGYYHLIKKIRVKDYIDGLKEKNNLS